MNEQILREKGNIDDKKREMRRLENDYAGRVDMLEEENMTLKSKLKKLELQATKLEEMVK